MYRVLNLESTKEYLNKIDESAYDFLNFWNKNQNINNDEELAKEYGEKITIVRTLLNKLAYRGIVTYDKVKDKNSGWYFYFWKINFEKLGKIIYLENKEKREKYLKKINLGNNYDVYSCKNNCDLVPFEIAAEYNFVCPNCNEKLEYYDYNKEINKMKNYVKDVEKEMIFITKLLSNNKKI